MNTRHPIRDEAQRELGQVGKTNNSDLHLTDLSTAVKADLLKGRDVRPIDFESEQRSPSIGINAAKCANSTQSADLFPDSLATERMTRDEAPRVAPAVSGQCARVLELIRKHQPLLSFVLTADYAIPEAAARVHDLRAKGFNVVTSIVPEVAFRGVPRRNVALYSIGSPEWGEPAKRQAGAIDPGIAALVAFGAVCLVLLVGAV